MKELAKVLFRMAVVQMFGEFEPTLLWMTGVLLAFGAGFLLGVVAF